MGVVLVSCVVDVDTLPIEVSKGEMSRDIERSMESPQKVMSVCYAP